MIEFGARGMLAVRVVSFSALDVFGIRDKQSDLCYQVRRVTLLCRKCAHGVYGLRSPL